MKKIILATLILLSAAVLVSCASIKEIPEDKTSAQIIQMGQNSVSVSDYKSALFCYQTAIERFGTNPTVYAEAKYEQGHVYLKQKKYEKAYQSFDELINIYEYNPGIIPPAYKKLAQIGITKIPAKKLAEIQKHNEPVLD